MNLKKLLIVGAALMATSLVHALTFAPYSPQALAKAQAAGDPVALHFHADWCPTCRAQDKALEVLKTEPNLNVLVLKVDYDSETELKKQLKVRAQSTFVVYRGVKETVRQTGNTSVDDVRAILRTAL